MTNSERRRRGLAVAAIGLVALALSSCTPSPAPQASAPEAVTTPAATTSRATTAVTGEEVAAYVAAALGADSLEDACLNDGIGWACNVVEIVPLTSTDIQVMVTAPAEGVHPSGIAMGFKNFTAGGENSPLPDLKTVIVLDESGGEVYRATE